MAKFKATINLGAIASIKSRLKNIGKFKQGEAKEIGNAALREIKKLISKGSSPIRGPGIRVKFRPYKNPDKYPGKKKAHKPVNLTLSGAFLNNLKASTVNQAGGFNAKIGYDDAKQQIKEKGHAEGAKGQPKRPTIPTASKGQTWAPSVLNVIVKTMDRIFNRRK